MNELNKLYHYVVNGDKAPTIKQTIEAHINTLEPGTRLHAKELWRTLFGYKVAQNSVTRALGQLTKEGKIKKSERMIGRNSEWKTL